MNEIERDYLAAKALGLGAVALLLKLWLIVMVVFIGLWVLGVILMYWYVIVPVGVIVVWWASRSSEVSVSSCDEPSSEDGR